MCMAEPDCKIFVASARCCLDYGILQHASVRFWMVCNADVYLPPPKCLTVVDRTTGIAIPPIDPISPEIYNSVNVSVISTPNARSQELLVDLPLAYFVPPISRIPGQLPLTLDLEAKRMSELDGLCSLRLRERCEWEGVQYDAVGAVQAVPLTSLLSANETALAEEFVQQVLEDAEQLPSPPPVPAPAPDFGIQEGSPSPAPELPPFPILPPDLINGVPELAPGDPDAAAPDGAPGPALPPPDFFPPSLPLAPGGAPEGAPGGEPAPIVPTSPDLPAPAPDSGIAGGPEGQPPPLVNGAPELAPALPSPSPDLVTGAPSPSLPLSPSPSPNILAPEPSTSLPLPLPPTAGVPVAAPAYSSPPPPAAIIGRRLLSLAGRLRDAVGGRGHAQQHTSGTSASSAGRRLKQELLTERGGMADPLMLLEGDLIADATTVDPLSFTAPSSYAGFSFRSGATVVGEELPVPTVDPITLPPLTDVLDPLFFSDLPEDYFISWLPVNTTESGQCSMTNSGDLPEAFLLGDFQDLVGYEDDCTPDTLPEVSGEEITSFSEVFPSVS